MEKPQQNTQTQVWAGADVQESRVMQQTILASEYYSEKCLGATQKSRELLTAYQSWKSCYFPIRF